MVVRMKIDKTSGRYWALIRLSDGKTLAYSLDKGVLVRLRQTLLMESRKTDADAEDASNTTP